MKLFTQPVRIFRLIVLSTIILFPSLVFSQQISSTSEIKRLMEIHQLPQYISNTEVNQFSSYDRTGGNNDGFEGTYSYLYKTPDSSLVLFDAKGKGIIERIWTPTPTDDTLDFYFDQSIKPSFSIKYRDLFSGKVYPFISPVAGQKVGGFYSYMPIPFKNGCKIVFRGKRILFHQFQYRKLDDSFSVKTFNPQFNTEEIKQLQQLAATWNKTSPQVKDHYKQSVQFKTTNADLLPGKSIVLAELKNGGRIVGIELFSANQFEGIENAVDIKISYDNESTPAIYAPVADFFGFAFGKISMKSLLGVDSSSRAYSLIPMPFDKNAKIELIYRNGESIKPVKINAKISYQLTKRNTDKEGKLYVNWKRNIPAIGEPYVFLEGKGKGHYVGTILQSQGRSYTEFTEFFEGDDSTVIDGKNSIHGTGSEDYFNGGWYAQPGGWVEPLGTHLHGCLDYSLPYSRTGGYRFYTLDKLPFNNSIYHSIEHGPEKNNRSVEYTSLAFYYAEKPVEQTSVPTNETSRVFIPDSLTFYARLMDHLSYEGSMKLKDGNAVLEPGESGTTNVNVAELKPGSYRLMLDMVADNSTNSELTVFANGVEKPLLNKFPSQKIMGNFYYTGDIIIDDPSKPIGLTFKSNNYRIALHRVMFIKK
jgi:hypothetical protein